MTDLRKLLSEAVRYNDARAEEHGFDEALRQLGLDDMNAVLHVAQQRAMRMVLVAEGSPINEETMRSVLAYPARRAMMKSLTSTFLDGLCAGWEAQRRVQEGRT